MQECKFVNVVFNWICFKILNGYFSDSHTFYQLNLVQQQDHGFINFFFRFSDQTL